ncbi:uncharacterized protein LOC118462470 [Anopheles albimanus]|uniref:Mutator-like transposase domain-containing protein n=1 Tax=Anopheles albimanus TaxID=7167 RepID=A0A182FTA6_ANOAL|nr:uncharacterized protein LOC118462470 [Anopheles albimanus]
MMTRRKSVHESTLQAQLQQERAAEDQLAIGTLASDIANILKTNVGPGTSANQSACLLPSSSPQTQTPTTSSTTKQAMTAGEAADAKKPAGSFTPASIAASTSCSITSPLISNSFGASSSPSVVPSAARGSSVNRSKTPRISKRSASLLDASQSPTVTVPSASNTVVQTSITASSVPASGNASTMITTATASTTPIQNPVQQTLAQNGMDPDEIPKFKGYRIIEIDHFLQWAAFSQFMHSKHCPGGLLKPYQEYISGCYSTFAMKCSRCSAIITRSSENYIHHNKLVNRLVKGTIQLGKDYDEMLQFMDLLEVPFVTRDEFQSVRAQLGSSLEDQSALQRAVEELEQASVQSKRKRHGSCKYHYEVLKVYLNKKMKKIEENLQLSVNDSVALAVNAHLKNVSHVQLMPNGHSSNMNCAILGAGGGGSGGGGGTIYGSAVTSHSANNTHGSVNSTSISTHGMNAPPTISTVPPGGVRSTMMLEPSGMLGSGGIARLPSFNRDQQQQQQQH